MVSSAANVPGDDYETVLEQYQAQGKRVGNVSTAEIIPRDSLLCLYFIQ